MEAKRNKTLIISPCGLPVPAVKGGAVLTLIESLIIQNEINNRIDLTVVGSFDGDAVEKSKQYKNTEFIFLRTPSILKLTDKIISFFERLVHKKPHQFCRKLYVISKIKKLLKRNCFDSVVFENAGYLIRVLKDKKIIKKYRGKLFYHLHNDIPDNVYKDGVRHCKLLLISNYLSKKIIRLCGEDIKKNCLILHNGFDYKHFSQKLPEAEKHILREKLGISDDKKIIVFAGRIDPGKGISQLAECFSHLGREDAVLLVIGSHNFGMKETSDFARKMSVRFSEMGESVKFTGYIPYDEIWKYYGIADVAVLPSMWEEPMGLTIVEAMSAGLPVITTKSGGIPEFIDERFGILLDRDERIVENLASAINEVLNNADGWKSRGKDASSYIAPIIDENNYYNSFCDYMENANAD